MARSKVHLFPEAADMRCGFAGLSALVRDGLGLDPCSGGLYLFANKRKNRLKLLYWDGDGLCVLAKRLEGGRLAVDSPRIEITIRAEELEDLQRSSGRRKLRTVTA
jgi:transposase